MNLNLMPELPEPRLPDLEDGMELDFEAIFADAVQDIVSTHSPRLSLTPALIQIGERRANRLAAAPRPVRKLRSLNLEPLFLELSPLQLEEKQDELLPAEETAATNPSIPALESKMSKTQPRHLRLVRVEPTSLLNLPESESQPESQPEALASSATPELVVLPTPTPITELEQPESDVISETALPEAVVIDSETEVEAAPQISKPQLTLLPPTCSDQVSAQLDRLYPLMGDMITQDNCLAEQHKQLQTTLQGMLTSLIVSDNQALAACLPTARDLKQQLQGCQKTLRQQRQTLQQLYTSCYQIQMQPLGDLLTPLEAAGQQLCQQQGKALTFHMAGASTLIEQRLLDKLQQPFFDLFVQIVEHGLESDSTQSPVTSSQITLWGYAWSQQIWLELRFAGQVDQLAPQLAEFTEQMQALYGTVRQTQLANGEIALTMRLPQFLGIAQVLLLKVEQQLLALPLNTLTQVLTVPVTTLQQQQRDLFFQTRLQPAADSTVSAEMVAQAPMSNCRYDEQVLVPVYSLKQCLAGQSPSIADFQSEAETVSLLCVGFADRQVAFLVDELVTEHEVAVRAISTASQAHSPSYICGYGLLSEEKLVPIIDPAPLLEQVAA